MKMEWRSSILVTMLISITSAHPQISIGKGGISASFGGYHASAGLGGLAGGDGAAGGLFAQAGLPDGTGAAAGLGGAADGGAVGGAYAGAGVAGGPKASAGLGGAIQGGAVGGTYAGAGVAGGPKAIAGLGGAVTGGMAGGMFAAADAGSSASANSDTGPKDAVELEGITDDNKDTGHGVVKATGTAGGGFHISKTKNVSGGSSGAAGGTIQGSLFDDIFNIPTSVLKAVNQFLNNNAQAKHANGGVGARKRVRGRFNLKVNGGARGNCADTPEGCVAVKPKAEAKVDANFHLNARAGAGCDGPDGCVVVKEKPQFASSVSSSSSTAESSSGNVAFRKNYDNVFNIPISALNSVNQLLNNLG